MGIGAAALVVGATLPGCSKANQGMPSDNTPLPVGGIKIDLNTSGYSGLKNSGGVVTVNNNIIVAHVSTGEYVALSNICTHQGCTVSFDGRSAFNCPCHGAAFSKTGAVTMGPASYPLRKYTNTLIGTLLTITD